MVFDYLEANAWSDNELLKSCSRSEFCVGYVLPITNLGPILGMICYQEMCSQLFSWIQSNNGEL